MLMVVIPPLRRDALARRAARDAEDERAASQGEEPGERADLALELSELARESAEALGADWVTSPPNDLAEKAELYARPLAVLRR
jgi:hypothetical protein